MQLGWSSSLKTDHYTTALKTVMERKHKVILMCNVLPRLLLHWDWLQKLRNEKKDLAFPHMNFIVYLNSGLPPTGLFNNPVSKHCYIPDFFKQFPPHGWTNSLCTVNHFLLPVNGPEPYKNIWQGFAKHDLKGWGLKTSKHKDCIEDAMIVFLSLSSTSDLILRHYIPASSTLLIPICFASTIFKEPNPEPRTEIPLQRVSIIVQLCLTPIWVERKASYSRDCYWNNSVHPSSSALHHLPGTSPCTDLNPWWAAWEGNVANLKKEKFLSSLQKVFFPKSNSICTAGVIFAHCRVTCAHFQRAVCREISHITHSPSSTDQNLSPVWNFDQAGVEQFAEEETPGRP